MVVDDEENIRQGLTFFIQSKSLGDVQSATNCTQALELAQRYKPDIVLLDIIMPGIDGLQAITWLRDLLSDMKVIIISGHSDTLYMRKAIKLGCFDYIIKPVDLNELEVVLRGAIHSYEAELSEKMKHQETEKKLQESLPVMQRDFLRELVQGWYQDEAIIISRMAYLGLAIPVNSQYGVFLFGVSSHNYQSPHTGSEYVISQIHERALKVIGNEMNVYCFHLEQMQFCVMQILPAFETVDYVCRTQKLFTMIAEAVQLHLSLPLVGGCGDIVQAIQDVQRSYQQATQAYACRTSDQSFAFFSELFPDQSAGQAIIIYEQHLVHAIREKDELNIRRLLTELMRLKTPEDRQDYALALTNRIQKEIAGTKNLLFVKDPKSKVDPTELVPCQEEEFLYRWISALSRQIYVIKSTRMIHLVKAASEIVENRYMENLGVSQIADLLSITPNYLSTIFKLIQGINLSIYLLKYRLSRAEAMLKETTLSIKDIATCVGILDANYFTRQFKRYYQQNPSDYRRQKG